jgi:hypothetical protein
MSAASSQRMDADERGANNGWIAGFIVILLVLVVGGVFWFIYHP